MDKRIAQVGIIVEDLNMADKVNEILHEFGENIIGRMGLPFRERNVNIISVVVYAENDTINKMVGRLGLIKGISAKALFGKSV